MNRTRLTLNSGAIFILAAALLWGTTGTAAAFAPSVGPLAIGAAAMGIGGVLQGCWAAPTIYTNRTILTRHWRLLSLSMAAAAIYPLAFYSSMRMAGVAVGTVVSIGSAPLFGAVADCLSRRQALSRRWLLGVSTGVAGVVLLALSPAHSAGSPEQRWIGIALGLIAAATYSFYTWGATKIMRNGAPSVPVMGMIFGSAGVLLLPVLIATGGPILASPQTLGVVAYLAIIPMFLGYILFGKGLETTSASTATTLTLAEPAAAALIAVLLLHEQLPTIGWVGITLLFISLTIASRIPSVARSPFQHEARLHPASPANRTGHCQRSEDRVALDQPGLPRHAKDYR